MAWLGETLHNIKGQISNFTNEVLSEDNPDPEEVQSSADSNRQNISSTSHDSTKESLKKSQQNVDELQGICEIQKNEIEQLKLLALEFQRKLQFAEENKKSLELSYKQELQLKEEENKQLKEHARHAENKIVKDAEKKEIADYEKEESKRDVETSTDNGNGGGGGENEGTEQQAFYVQELEERLNSYQNELYSLRGELLSVQQELDKGETLNGEICQFLKTNFLIDGSCTIKHPLSSSSIGDPSFIQEALRQLSFLWKELLEQKGTLERAVTRLSGQRKENDQVDLSSDLDKVNDPRFVPDYLIPAKIDSFGLETIQEEDPRGDESGCPEVESEVAKISIHHTKKDLIVKESSSTPILSSTDNVSDSFTQTEEVVAIDAKDNEKEEIKSKLKKLLENENFWNQKEREWKDNIKEKEEKIRRLEGDLERLKSHLVELEDSYTGELLLAAEKEKGIVDQMGELTLEIQKFRAKESSEKSGEVREELSRVTAERDEAILQTLRQKEKLTSQLTSLHFVLEQFQKDKETEMREAESLLKRELNETRGNKERLVEELKSERELLEKARSGLNIARTLNLQLEEKGRTIIQLKQQVAEKEVQLEKLQTQLFEVSNGKIDRFLVKNLVVGYFSTPPDKRETVLKILANILDFDRGDRQKTGLEGGSGLWPFSSPSSSLLQTDKQSLSEAFINFLEKESEPKIQMQMKMRVEGSSPSSQNPSSSSTPPPPPPQIQEMTLPVFNQSDRSNSILKDVLNPKP